MEQDEPSKTSSPICLSHNHTQISIWSLAVTGNAFPCCYQGVFRETDKYLLSFDVFVKKWLDPLSWPLCVLPIKAHESIEFALFHFSKRVREKISWER